MSQALRDGPIEELAERLLLGWRVRCAVQRAQWELAVGAPAAALCGAAALTIVEGFPATEMAVAVRRWREEASSADDERDALQCLAETAVEATAEFFGDFRPRGLELFLAALAAEVESAASEERPGAASVIGWGDRHVFERDLTAAVAVAEIGGGDVSLALLELEEPPRPRLRLVRPDEKVGEGDSDNSIVGLFETVQRGVGGQASVYWVGERKLAVLAIDTSRAELGDMVLLATCLPGPGFMWGAASLQGVGWAAIRDPDVLVMLAETDLVFRRRDLAEATAAVTRRRFLSVVGPAAAAAVLVVAATIGLSTPKVQGPGTQALPASLGSGPAQSAPRNGSPSSEPPTTVVPPVPSPSANVTVSGPSGPTGHGSPAVLVSAPRPAPTGTTPPPPTSTTPPPAPAPGQSGAAPGHQAGHGGGKHV